MDRFLTCNIPAAQRSDGNGGSGELDRLRRRRPTAPKGEEAPSTIVYCPEEQDDIAKGVRCLQALASEVPLRVFVPSIDPQLAGEVLRAGARGLIHATMHPEHIVRTLLIASDGGVAVPRTLLEPLLGRMPKGKAAKLYALKPR
jgi:DNA-binding NarL/FixJ family response regulator